MPLFRHLCQIIACASLVTPFATAHSGLSTQLPGLPAPISPSMPEPESRSYLDQLWSLPLFRFFAPPYAPPVPDVTLSEMEEVLTTMADPYPGCSVAPLHEVEDVEALTFENRTGALGAVDLNGLTPDTAVAMAKFQRAVTSAGGAIAITSAYRPAAYQEHLREVWEKWMLELRPNHDPLCFELRAAAQEEFQRHQLLESQRPVVASDHTRGLSFDAWVQLPGRRVKKGRRINIDALARQAGVRRPDVRRDPVHFKLAM
ncbi:MAG TPA: hypothetical protein VER03_06405 [Bryobacteraceae bacterium]|nr:hypothetical protein [Bryobacteraceae bacterium]